MIKTFHGTSSAYVLVLEATWYLGALALLLRNFLQGIRRPPMEPAPTTDESNLVFVPIGFIELASGDASSMILDNTLI